MTFEEIRNINLYPFSDEWLEKTAYRNLKQNQGVANIWHYTLIHKYFAKFNQKYGTSFWEYNMPNIIFVRIFVHDFTSIGFKHVFEEYESIFENWFLQTAKEIGFEYCHCALDEELFDREIWYGNKKVRKRFLKDRLLDIFDEKYKMWRSFFWYSLNHIHGTLGRMSVGYIYFLRNKSMCELWDFCEKYETIVKSELDKEKEALEEALQLIFEPFTLNCISDIMKVGGYVYWYFDRGGNPTGMLDFLQLNPAWFIACFVYKNLLFDFRKKVKNLSDKYPELRDVTWTSLD